MLVQLAEEGFVNPKQARTVRRLVQRGLVARDPALRLMNPGFALFVDRIHAPEAMARWEEPTRGLGWANLRWAFLARLAVIVGFEWIAAPPVTNALLHEALWEFSPGQDP